MRLRQAILISTLFFLILARAAAADRETLAEGFGKSKWGMTLDEIVSVYQIELNQPKSADAEGTWAVLGPAPGELTVSGEALGEAEVRSVSFGIHSKFGLAIIHVRFKDTNDPKYVEKQLPLWEARFGTPKERRPGPKIVWEDAESHVELTYHTVSPRHPTPSDHLAIVLWSLPLMEKIEAEGIEERLPDVETLAPLQAPHKSK
ncbi:MAG: hypothetical protein ACE5GK_00210 [Nitrospiria bacterium]